MANQANAQWADLGTQTRILRAATSLFADHGFAGVSVRQILDLAGANVASVNYYFGSKQALYQAASEHFIEPIIEQRMARLDTIKQTQGFSRQAIPDLLRAYIEPHYAVAIEPGGEDYLRMFSRFQSETRQVSKTFFDRYFGASRAAYVNALKQALSPIEADDLNRGFSILVATMLLAPVDHGYHQLANTVNKTVDYQALTEQIVRFSSAGLIALSSPGPTKK